MRYAFPGFIAFSLMAALPAQADNPPEQFTIKQKEPSVGSTVRRDIVRAGTIPLDKTYAELTPAQKTALKAQYEHMDDNDEPPFPVAGLQPLYQDLANVHEHLDMQFKGELTMYVTIDSAGKPTAISVEKSPDPEVTQNVARMLMLEKFKPALCHGSPCAQIFPFRAELIGPDVDLVTNGKPSSSVFITQHWP